MDPTEEDMCKHIHVRLYMYDALNYVIIVLRIKAEQARDSYFSAFIIKIIMFCTTNT